MAHRVSVVVAVATLSAVSSGCAMDGDRDALAEEYAQRESRQIDEASFRHARDRNRLLRSTEAAVQASPPLPIDRGIDDRWQFGLLDHPIDDRPVCAALSGATGNGGYGSVLRVVVLENLIVLESDRSLGDSETDISVRIDSGLPIPFDVYPNDARLATGPYDPADGYPMLAGGTVLSIATSTDSQLADERSSDERLVLLEGVDPMLEELARCDTGSIDLPASD